MALDAELSIRNVMNTGSSSFRLVRNPVDGALYYLKINGQIYRVNLSAISGASTSTLLYTSADHQVTSAAGMAFGPEGSIYLSSNTPVSNNTYTVSSVTKGVFHPINKTRAWSVLAQTVPYPGGARIFSHQMNAILLSRDSKSILVNIARILRIVSGLSQVFLHLHQAEKCINANKPNIPSMPRPADLSFETAGIITANNHEDWNFCRNPSDLPRSAVSDR